VGFQDPEKENEIEQYREARYIGPIESCMHLFGITMYVCQPPIIRLSLHLENEERVAFRNADHARYIVAQPPPITQLTAWFLYNLGEHEDGRDAIQQRTNLDLARQLRYVDFPRWFVYRATLKVSTFLAVFQIWLNPN
jgi:hypothetical protein